MKYSDELLREEVKKVNSMAALMANLGVTRISGGMHAHLKKRLSRAEIDISHWNRHGKGRFSPRKGIEDVLIFRNGPYKEHTIILLRALLQSGVPYSCSKCDLENWLGEFIRLHIDHINGNGFDNRKENLRFLCPNCHSQTDTYAATKTQKEPDWLKIEKLVKEFNAGVAERHTQRT